MGGKNHQPCKSYLLNSTRLSKHLSLAYAHLELGNAALEDILIGELSPDHDSAAAMTCYDRLNAEMSASITELGRVQLSLADLRQQMDDTGFVDLPTLQRIDLTAIGAALAFQGMVSPSAWKSVQERMTSRGFYEMIRYFDNDITELLGLTRKLWQDKFRDHLKHPVAEGKLTDIVEENAPGSFKREFAAVYTKWIEFSAVFLASSLMSTELWYAFTGKGSLVPSAQQLHAA
jgi:hypothetical protein